MRLVLVIAHLRRAGCERVASILASSWAQAGHQVSLLTLDHGETPAYFVDPAVTLRNLGLLADSRNLLAAVSRNIGRVRALRRAIRKARPDTVISFMDAINVVTLLATRRLGCPVVVCEQTDPGIFEIGLVWKILRFLVYPFADMLVCPTRGALAGFQKTIPVSGCVIPNPIDVPPDSGSSQRSPQAGFNLVAMGRLVPEKGFDLLLLAYARIAGRHSDSVLTIYGEGPLLYDLEAQAKSLGLEQRVRFAGAVADPFARLRAADLFVFSSRTEAFGMALAEAMACGLPVISFDCPSGPREIIRAGVDGVLVPANDVAALASALDRLMSDPQERRRLAARAPEISVRLSIKRVLHLWQRLFDRLAAPAAAP